MPNPSRCAKIAERVSCANYAIRAPIRWEAASAVLAFVNPRGCQADTAAWDRWEYSACCCKFPMLFVARQDCHHLQPLATTASMEDAALCRIECEMASRVKTLPPASNDKACGTSPHVISRQRDISLALRSHRELSEPWLAAQPRHPAPRPPKQAESEACGLPDARLRPF